MDAASLQQRQERILPLTVEIWKHKIEFEHPKVYADQNQYDRGALRPLGREHWGAENHQPMQLQIYSIEILYWYISYKCTCTAIETWSTLPLQISGT